jgi:hypothetical protein
VAFGVAFPFLPALRHVRGLGPSEVLAVLAAGTAVDDHGASSLAPPRRLGKRQQTLAILVAVAAVIAFGYPLKSAYQREVSFFCSCSRTGFFMSDSKRPILVFGATGQQGGSV